MVVGRKTRGGPLGSQYNEIGGCKDGKKEESKKEKNGLRVDITSTKGKCLLRPPGNFTVSLLVTHLSVRGKVGVICIYPLTVFYCSYSCLHKKERFHHLCYFILFSTMVKFGPTFKTRSVLSKWIPIFKTYGQ